MVADILHTITNKPQLSPPSPFLHQVRETLQKMNTSTTTQLPPTTNNNDNSHVKPVPRVVTKDKKDDLPIPSKPFVHPRARLYTRFKTHMLDTLR